MRSKVMEDTRVVLGSPVGGTSKQFWAKCSGCGDLMRTASPSRAGICICCQDGPGPRRHKTTSRQDARMCGLSIARKDLVEATVVLEENEMSELYATG